MIDKYLLQDLGLRNDEKGELARWVIQLQTDVDTERRKSASLESVIYARDTRIAELEAKDKRIVELSRLLAHNIERAEEAEKRVAELSELETQVKVWESAATKHLARAEEAEKRLATPVRLPKRWDVTGQVNPPSIVEVQFEQQNRTHDQCAEAIRAAGFTVSEE